MSTPTLGSRLTQRGGGCRTFRGRKELYARTLERELDRIRVSEAQLMKQCARLQDEVESLTACLARCGVASPSAEARSARYPAASPPSSTGPAAGGIVPPGRGRSATHTGHGPAGGGGPLDSWAVKRSPPYQPFPGPEAGHHHDHYHAPSEDNSPSVCFSASPESLGNSFAYSTPQGSALRVADLEPSVVGMEFVLMYVWARLPPLLSPSFPFSPLARRC